ncbi:hypothetical protein Tco_0039443 [Tanacetum coccineum]
MTPHQKATAFVFQVDAEDLANTYISSPPTTTTYKTIINPQQRCISRILTRAKQRKNDSKQAIMQKLAKHEQRLNALSQLNTTDIIEESVQANVQNEVKNQLPKALPDTVSEYIQPRLKHTVLRVLKSNQINMFKTPTTTTDNLIEYEMKLKLYNMMFKSRSYGSHERHLELYNALMSSMMIDEMEARDPQENEIEEGSTILVANKLKELRNKEKLTKVDLRGADFEVLKSRYRNNLEPLPLEGPPGRRTLPSRYLFNRDLGYLMHKNKEEKYASSWTCSTMLMSCSQEGRWE